MTNILEKSPAELLPMLPGLTDDELNAAAAKWCEGKNVKPRDMSQVTASAISRYYIEVNCGGHFAFPGCPSYTTDGRDAGRLQEKYRISVCPMGETSWWVRVGIEKTRIHINSNPRRAITEAALAKALTEADHD